MKTYFISLLTIVFAITATTTVSAQTSTTKTDSIANTIKMKALHTKKDKLTKQIRVEDAKRNAQISGVSPERMEEINDRQDSICLELRSQLVEVMLEIKECAPGVPSQQIAQQYNSLLKRREQEQTSTQNDSTANKPEKTNKPVAEKPTKK